MSLSELCIRRPVMTTLITLSFIVFGLFAYRLLAVAALPRVDFPTISVSANLPGASPESMASSVAAPLERQFSTISGITAMTSISSLGSTNITLQFDLDRNIDGAALDVQAAISGSLRRLPPDLPNPPSFRKVNPADQPVLFIALTSDTMQLLQVNDYAEQILQQQISQINGVAQVQVYGSQKYAVRVTADPEAVSARGLSFADIQKAVSSANSNQPTGTLRGTERNVTIEASGQLKSAADYGAIIVSSKNGVPVKLEDIATVRDSVENDQTASWYGTKRSLVLAVFRQSDANTVDVVDQVKAKLPQYRAQLPASITMDVLSDRSIPIREAVADVQVSLGIAMVLVVLVIFLFLKSLSATIIPALALPVSLIGTFAAMYAFGYSIDNISLLALTLSVGFVVDDAIVMLENIMRHIEEGMKPYDAALKGSREIGFTIISITLSLVAVFIPVFFMGGVVGRVFREFAGTISVAILVSGFVSLTLTPMICARILREHQPDRRERLFSRSVDAGFNAVLALYRVALDFVIRFRLITLILTIGTIGVSGWLYVQIPKGFFPQEDTGLLRASVEAAPDVSFSSMAAYQIKLNEAISKDPAIEYFTSSAGFGSTNQAFMFIQLKPRQQRDEIGKIIARLRKAASGISGINAVFVPIQNFNLNAGRLARAQYQYTMQSSDISTLFAAVPKILEQFRKTPELRDVTGDLQIANPQIVVDLDREKAANLGVTSEQVRQTLYNAFGSRQISTIYTASSDYAVILEANRDYQSDPAALSRLFVKNATGQNVPLEAVANIRRNIGPLSINRQSQQPAVTLSFNLAPDVALGQAVEAIRKAEKVAGLPSTIITGFAGSAQQFQDSLKGQGLLIMAAVLVIYIVLGVLYESFIHPITILSGLPSAGLGALLALQFFKLDLSVIAIIGILMLVGIVKKNAIMMVDFAIERRQAGADALSAIREAALVRFRPIMMTTFAALFGTLPIALGTGAGSELRQPLGIAVVGGLAVSQILTLFITPVVYIYLDRLDSYFKGRAKAAPVIESEAF